MTPLRVALLWHSTNSANLGVGALTVADVALVREAARRAGREVELLVLGFAGELAPYPQLAGVGSYDIDGRRLVRPSGLLRVLRSCDLVIDIGGGDSFSDIYGLKRLAYLLATKFTAVGLRRPLVLAPQTIGPFESRGLRFVSELAVLASRAAFARDETSIETLALRRARGKVRRTSDVAFVLPHTPSERDGRTRVGLNVSALLYHGGYSGRNQFGLRMDYRRFVDRLLEAFSAREDVELVLVPHVVSTPDPTEDDLALSHALAERAGLAEPPAYADPVSAKSFISSCDFLIGSRMHACIAAVSAGRATVPVAYSRKFSGLFDAIGYRHTLDARQVEAEAGVEAVLTAFSRREELAGDAVRAAAVARERIDLYRDALTDVIASV